MALTTKSLNYLQGTTVAKAPETPETPVSPVKQPVSPAYAPAYTPTYAPAPAPVSPSGPATRTIYLCPDTFTEVGGLCEKTFALHVHHRELHLSPRHQGGKLLRPWLPRQRVHGHGLHRRHPHGDRCIALEAAPFMETPAWHGAPPLSR